MADNIINCVDNLQLNSLNSLTHLLNTEDTDELNVIRHSPYISDDELIQSRLHNTNQCQRYKISVEMWGYTTIDNRRPVRAGVGGHPEQ